MALTCRKEDGKNLISITGPLTIYEVTDLKEELISILSAGDENEISLAQVEECDTAGVQLLFAALKTGKADEKIIRLRDISPAVQKAADRIGVASWNI